MLIEVAADLADLNQETFALIWQRAEEYRGEKISESDPGYSGMAEMDVLASDLDELYDDGVIDLLRRFAASRPS